MAGGLLGQGSLTTYNPTFREKATDLLRGLLFSDDREGQRKAERLSNVLETITPYGVATGVDDMREAVGQGDYATAGMMGAMAMVPGPSPKIKAYHGSPHSFDRFDMSKIGTGEGAQAYGHGLYFAEAEDVARQYRENLASGFKIDGKEYNATTTKAGAHTPGHHAANALSRFKGDKATAIEWLKGGGPTDKEAAKLLQKAKSIEPWNGSMYEVNINASPDDFLDWDKPLSEQPPQTIELVRQGLKDKGYLRPNDNGPRQLTAALRAWRMAEGGMAETSMEALLGGRGGILGATPQESSQKLREAGIPGIKYLDAGSRGKGDGSRNYVVFDDKLIEIVRKYGIAGASAMLGYNILNMVDPAQARQMQAIDAQRPQTARSGW